jgi:hypothetical protein
MRKMHIYAFLPVRKRLMPFFEKNRLPMKKSNVRFFHGEPVFSGIGLHQQKMYKYTDKSECLCIAPFTSHLSPLLVQLVQLVQVLFPHACVGMAIRVIS